MIKVPKGIFKGKDRNEMMQESKCLPLCVWIKKKGKITSQFTRDHEKSVSVIRLYFLYQVFMHTERIEQQHNEWTWWSSCHDFNVENNMDYLPSFFLLTFSAYLSQIRVIPLISIFCRKNLLVLVKTESREIIPREQFGCWMSKSITNSVKKSK